MKQSFLEGLQLHLLALWQRYEATAYEAWSYVLRGDELLQLGVSLQCSLDSSADVPPIQLQLPVLACDQDSQSL